MIEKVLKIQQKMSAWLNPKLDLVHKELNGKFKTLATRVMRLNTQVFQTAQAVEMQERLVKGKTEESERHHVDAILDYDFGEVFEHEKLEEGDFLVQCFMSFGSGYWCRSTLEPELSHLKVLIDTLWLSINMFIQ